MLGALLRALVILVLIVGAIAFATGYWMAEQPASETAAPAGPAEREGPAAETGRKVGERIGAAADEAALALADAGITARIKSKMALDEFVKARRIDVDTSNGVVTLSGVVHSEAERDRAVRLARETAGVRSVIDRLRIESP